MEQGFAKLKTVAVAAFGALSAWLGWLAVPVVLLVVCNVLDYVTGIIAAPARGQKRSSVRGFAGIVKKIGMWVLVGIGVMMDILLAYLTETMGMTLPVSFAVGCLVCVWLLANEMVSVVENIDAMGVKVPFLLSLVKWVRQSGEKKLGDAVKDLPDKDKLEGKPDGGDAVEAGQEDAKPEAGEQAGNARK